jgi:hypothetical protein
MRKVRPERLKPGDVYYVQEYCMPNFVIAAYDKKLFIMCEERMCTIHDVEDMCPLLLATEGRPR